MSSPELKRFFSDLRAELNKEGRPRPPKGELLARAFDIPLAWPPAEFPADREPLDQMKRALGNWGGNLHVVESEAELMAKVKEIAEAALADPNQPPEPKRSGARPAASPSTPRGPRRDEIEFDLGAADDADSSAETKTEADREAAQQTEPAEAAIRAGEPAKGDPASRETAAVVDQPPPRRVRLSRWHCDRLDRYDWDGGLADLNPDWFNPTAADLTEAARDPHTRLDLIHRIESIHIGITDADFAVAQTGTLCMLHDPARHAFLNLLPWTHVAVITEDQVLRTLQDLGDRVAELNRDSPLPPNTVFITGPSRSGDIDIRHGRGAAGPGNVHVIVVKSD